MRRRGAAVVAAAMGFAAVAASSRAASAQQAVGFAVDRFDPAERGSDWFAGESLDLRGHLRPAVGITGDYSYRSLAFYDAGGTVVASLVRNQLVAHLGGSLVLWDRLRAGLELPFALYQDGHGLVLAGTRLTPPGTANIGDPRLGADVRLYGEYGDRITLAA